MRRSAALSCFGIALVAAAMLSGTVTAQHSLKSTSDAIAAQKAADEAAFSGEPWLAPVPTLDSRQAEVQLRNSNREWLHHGDPLAVVGREQDGNDLRSKTSVLTHFDGTAPQVDIDELHRRRLAMYDAGAVFHDAAPATRTGAGEPGPLRSVPSRPQESSAESGSGLTLMSIGVCLLGLVWAVKRRDA